MLVNGRFFEVLFYILLLNIRLLKELNKYYMKNKYLGGIELDD